MKKNNEKVILVFQSTHETLKAEALFMQQSILVKPVIKPRAISSDCQMALECDKYLQDKIEKICYAKNFLLVGIYKV